MTTVTGRFDLTRWDEEIYDDAEGAKLLTVSSAKTFEGGIAGTSAVRLLQAFAQEGSAAYVGIERVTAEIDGRKGTFVLAEGQVRRVPGSRRRARRPSAAATRPRIPGTAGPPRARSAG